MFVDPVVEEMRRNGARVAEECGGDIRRIADRLRREQAAHADRLVSRPSAIKPKSPKVDSSNPASR